MGYGWGIERGSRRTVRAVNHHDFMLVFLPQRFLGRFDAGGIVIRALGATAQDDEAVLVATRARDGGETLFRHTHEVVLGGRGAHGVDGDGEGAVGPVLEADGEGESAG